jgi:probable rRNA maturation factor
MVRLSVRNESSVKHLYRSDVLGRLAERVRSVEFSGARSGTPDWELSVLFCDDAFMTGLNKQYCNKKGSTDVLSFEQDEVTEDGFQLLGDIVISLETVASRSPGDRAAMRDEVRLLFCHGLLHLLGYDHGTQKERKEMNKRQARYLGLTTDAAWRSDR